MSTAASSERAQSEISETTLGSVHIFLRPWLATAVHYPVYYRDQWCRPMYPECVAFLRNPMRVREIVVLVRLSHSHGFAQKRNAFRIHGTAP